jgi:hypothetical protein
MPYDGVLTLSVQREAKDVKRFHLQKIINNNGTKMEHLVLMTFG